MDEETIEALHTVAAMIRQGEIPGLGTNTSDVLTAYAKDAEKVNLFHFSVGRDIQEWLLNEHRVNIRPDVPATAMGEKIAELVKNYVA